MIDSDWLTARETAAYLRVSERQLLRWRKTGILEEDINLKSVNDGSSVMSYTQIYQCKKVSNLF